MLAVAQSGRRRGNEVQNMEKQWLYSVRYAGEKHTLSFWLVNGRFMYSVDKRQQLKDFQIGYKKGRIRREDYINVTQNIPHNFMFL